MRESRNILLAFVLTSSSPGQDMSRLRQRERRPSREPISPPPHPFQSILLAASLPQSTKVYGSLSMTGSPNLNGGGQPRGPAHPASVHAPPPGVLHPLRPKVHKRLTRRLSLVNATNESRGRSANSTWMRPRHLSSASPTHLPMPQRGLLGLWEGRRPP